MAKRRKLNKRVVILLAVMGGIVVIGGAVLSMQMLLPKDPWVDARIGDKNREAGDYPVANRAYSDAIRSAVRYKHPDTYLFYYKRGDFLLEWVKSPSLTDAERQDKLTRAVEDLRLATRHNPHCLEAQRLLFDIAWNTSYLVYLRNDPGASPRWDLCIAEADKMIELEPNNAMLYSRRGFAYSLQAKALGGKKNMEMAEDDLGKAIKLKGDEVNYWVQLARFVSEVKRPADAIAVFDQAVEVIPNSAELRAAYATYLRTQDRYEDARKQLQEAILRQPSSTLGNIALAELFFRERRWDEAQKSLEAAKDIDKTDYRIYLFEAELLQKRGQTDKNRVAEVYRAGLSAIASRAETEPASQETVTDRRRMEQAKDELNNRLANVVLDMAEAARGDERAKLLAEARGRIDQLTSVKADNPAKLKLSGRIAMIEGRFGEALKLLDESYKRSGGTDPQTAHLLVDLYLTQGSPGKAQEILDGVLKRRGPMTANLWLVKARIAIQYYRDYDEAARSVARALSVEPENGYALRLQRALNLVRSSDVELPRDLELTPDMTQMFLDWGEALLADREYNKAVRLTENLYRRDPENLAVIQRLHWLYLAGRATDQAKKLLADASARHPDNKRLKNELELMAETDPNQQFVKRMALIDTDEGLSEFRKAIDRAATCLRAGKGAEYVQYLQEAVKIDPQSPVAVDQLFSVALTVHDWALAEKCVALVRQGDLDKAGGRIFSARLAMVQEAWDRAIGELTEALKQDSDLKQARVMLAECYMNIARSDADRGRAEEILKDVLSKDPGSASALILMARIKEAKGELAEHADFIRRVARIAPQHPYVQDRLTELMNENDKPEEAIKRREDKFRANRDDLRNCQRLAELYRRTGQTTKYKVMTEYIFAHSPDPEFGASVLAEYYLTLGQTTKVDETMATLIKVSKDKVRAWVLYGKFLARYAPGEAEAAFEKAVQADPKDDRGHLAIADFLAKARKWQEAANSLDKVVELKPTIQAVRKARARYRIYAGELAPAASQLETILTADPADAEALALKGLIALRKKDYPKAKALLDSAIGINPNNYEALQFRAEVYIAQVDPVMAKKDLQTARQLTSSPEVLMQLATIHRQMTEPEQAEIIYKSILAGRKDFEPAYFELIDLYMNLRQWGRLEPLLSEAKRALPRNPNFCLAEARMWDRRQEDAKKIAALAEAFRLAPRAPIVIDSYLQALLDAGQYDMVLKGSEDLLKAPGIGPQVTAIRAAALVKLNDVAQADELFKSALKEIGRVHLEALSLRVERAYGLETAVAKLTEWAGQKQDDWRLEYVLSLLQRRLGEADRNQLPQSITTMLKARELAPDPHEKAQVSGSLGVTFHTMRMMKEAEEAYLAVLAVEPNDVRALNNVAYLLANDRDEAQRALPYIRRAVEQRDEDPDVLDTYGWVLAKAKSYREAERVLARAVQLREPTEVIRYHLGYVYEQTGQLNEALKQYRLGLEMIRNKETDPIYQTVSEALRRVQDKLRSGT